MEQAKQTMKRKSLIVDQYVTTDLPIPAIIQRTPQESAGPVAVALLQLCECLGGHLLARTAMKTAQEAPIENADPEMAILMLANWAELSCRIGRPSEAEALIRRVRSMVTADTHPAVVAASRFAESAMADATGNKAEREAVLGSILKALPIHSPRRKFYSWEMALLLAQQGRGIEAQREVRDLGWQCGERFKPSRVSIVRLVDAIETGRVIDAVQFMNQLATVPQAELQVGRINVRDYLSLLALMQTVKGQPPQEPNRPEDQPATWIQIVTSLLQRKQDDALQTARLEARKLLGPFFGTGFESFGLIRAELSAGHWEGAVRLLKMRNARGNRNYLDAFFLARAERLGGNMALAARHFAEAMQQVEHYQARGRLEFELRLSCELDPNAVAELSAQAEEYRKSVSSPSRQKTAGTSNAEEHNAGQQAGIQAILGKSRAVNELRDTILRFADINAPVLITGETGTGKELVAKALHEAGRNRNLPFNAVNCGAITETLLESELFGHERGAFTGADKTNKGLFEATGRGTLLLDEIGDISPRLQTALLRVLEAGEIRAVGSSVTRKVYCRVLAATNADLNAMVERGTFRKDLLYRLQRLEIHVPPLRDRRDDVLTLARHFFDSGREMGAHAVLSQGIVSALENYTWPGNVRELRNVVERMRLMQSDKLAYDIEDLELRVKPGRATGTENSASAPPHPSPPPPPVPAPEHPAAPPASAATAGTPSDRQTQAPRTHPLSAHPSTRETVEEFLRAGRSPLRRIERLRSLFNDHKRLTRAEVIALLGISPNTATKDLESLRDEGFIVRVEPSASSRSFYFEISGDQPPTSTTGISPATGSQPSSGKTGT
jgi:DNA-binding NtrC family response regulator